VFFQCYSLSLLYCRQINDDDDDDDVIDIGVVHVSRLHSAQVLWILVSSLSCDYCHVTRLLLQYRSFLPLAIDRHKLSV